MLKSKPPQLTTRWHWTGLLLLLLAAMFLSAASSNTRASEIAEITACSLVFAGTLWAANIANLLRFLGIGLIGIWFFLGLIGPMQNESFIGPMFILVTACILVGCLLVTVSELAHNNEAGLDPLMGAVFGFILIAVSWSMLYLRIEVQSPGSFNSASERMTSDEFMYFSLVTMTTLGYGEITPVAPIPRLLAGLQAATGTIYIAVFIGRVVSRFKT